MCCWEWRTKTNRVHCSRTFAHLHSWRSMAAVKVVYIDSTIFSALIFRHSSYQLPVFSSYIHTHCAFTFISSLEKTVAIVVVHLYCRYLSPVRHKELPQWHRANLKRLLPLPNLFQRWWCIVFPKFLRLHENSSTWRGALWQQWSVYTYNFSISQPQPRWFIQQKYSCIFWQPSRQCSCTK